jgi:acyl-CoA thioesterase
MEKELEEKTPLSTGPHSFEPDRWLSCSPFERLLNITIVEARDGKAVLTMPFLIEYAQGEGLMHGGALVSLADTAVAMAVKSVVEPPSHFATTSLESRFLLPVTKGSMTAKAEIVSREGRRLKGKASVYDEDGRTVMEFSSTFKISKNVKL